MAASRAGTLGGRALYLDSARGGARPKRAPLEVGGQAFAFIADDESVPFLGARQRHGQCAFLFERIGVFAGVGYKLGDDQADHAHSVGRHVEIGHRVQNQCVAIIARAKSVAQLPAQSRQISFGVYGFDVFGAFI